MTAPRRSFVAALLVLAAIAAVAATVRPGARAAVRPRGGVASVTSTVQVCPSVSGSPVANTTTMTVADLNPASAAHPAVHYEPLLGPAPALPLSPRPAARVTKASSYAAVAVQASGRGADRVIASQLTLTTFRLDRAIAEAPCTPPATDQWFAGAEGRIGYSDVLILANAADAPAVVTLSMWGAHGPLSVPGTQGIVIAPHRWVTRSIADLAPDVPAVAVHVHADSGSVSAAIHDVASQGVSPAGGDWIPPTLGPARSMVVPGILRIGGRKTLVLANPGDRDAAASLRLVTTNGAFAPAGSQSVVVPAGHTSAVDLTTAIAGEASAVLVTSDQPLFGEVQNVASLPQKYNEFAWLPAQPPVRAPVGVATTTAPFGQLSRLVVTAPLGGGQLRLSVPGGRSQTVAVPGGRTSTFDLAAMFPAAPSDPRPILVEPIGANPLYLARTLLVFGAHGPLMSSLPPAAFAQPVPLPAVLPDLRVATR